MELPFTYKAVDALLSLKTLLSAQAAQKPTHWKDLLTLLVLPSVRLSSVHKSPENSASEQDCEEAHLKEEWMLKSRLTAVTKAKICSQLCYWLATSLSAFVSLRYWLSDWNHKILQIFGSILDYKRIHQSAAIFYTGCSDALQPTATLKLAKGWNDIRRNHSLCLSSGVAIRNKAGL